MECYKKCILYRHLNLYLWNLWSKMQKQYTYWWQVFGFDDTSLMIFNLTSIIIEKKACFIRKFFVYKQKILNRQYNGITIHNLKNSSIPLLDNKCLFLFIPYHWLNSLIVCVCLFLHLKITHSFWLHQGEGNTAILYTFYFLIYSVHVYLVKFLYQLLLATTLFCNLPVIDLFSRSSLQKRVLVISNQGTKRHRKPDNRKNIRFLQTPQNFHCGNLYKKLF